MALGTRGVLAIIAGTLMILAMVVARFERRLLGTWLLTISFAVATLWSIMSIAWAGSNPSPLTPELWLMVTSMAAAATVYFGYLGLYGEGLGE